MIHTVLFKRYYFLRKASFFPKRQCCILLALIDLLPGETYVTAMSSETLFTTFSYPRQAFYRCD
ncbi:hypothetical protein NE18_12800 [Salmonella enterica]|nr:hypothetical protein [Salmonella enterica]